MDNTFVELGITDYLHELELWEDRLTAWERQLSWPEETAAMLDADYLLGLGHEAVLLCKLLRLRTGLGEDFSELAEDERSVDELETELELTIWRIMQEEERLRAVALPYTSDLPAPLPRARVCLRTEDRGDAARGRGSPGRTDGRDGAANSDAPSRQSSQSSQ